MVSGALSTEGLLEAQEGPGGLGGGWWRGLSEGGLTIGASAQCPEDLSFLSEGHGNPWGLCTKDRQGLTRVGCQVARELGAGGWKVKPVRESGETREGQDGSHRAGAGQRK